VTVPRDAFGNDVTARTNVLDVAAHYPYNPERHRLYVDGSRVFPEYGSVSQYTHSDDTHELSPAAGETVTLESAERPRYVVQYELATTWAFAINQSLQSGDSIRVGLYDGTDGWYMEQNGSHADDEADFVLERAGSEVYREEDLDIRIPSTVFGRLKLQTGWYDVTRQRWERSYPNNGDQENPVIGKFSADTSRGSRTGNLPCHFSVTASGSTTGLVLEAGSFAQVNLGTTTPQTRTKAALFEGTTTSTDVWEPVRAFRVDPDRSIVNVQLSELSALSYSADTTVKVAIYAFADSNVAFGGGDSWGTPASWTSSNNVMQTRTDVDTIVDDSGSTSSGPTDPGGYQMGHAVLTPTGTQFQKGASSEGFEAKRNLPRDDIAVVCINAGTTGDAEYSTTWEQDW